MEREQTQIETALDPASACGGAQDGPATASRATSATASDAVASTSSLEPTITRQKGAAGSDPSPFRRWLISRLLTHAVSEARETRRRARAEAKRVRQGRRHVVEYFHQVDDGYSHLAIQTLGRLAATYDIDIRVHLVPEVRDDNSPEPDLLKDMARRDAADVAKYYGLEFPPTDALPSTALCDLALSVLCTMNDNRIASLGPQVSACLWRGDAVGLQTLAAGSGPAPADAVAARLAAGLARRTALKHYSGAMFWYEGEWYWGVDRLSHLEERLKSLGAARDKDAPQVAPRPVGSSSFPPQARAMTLEFYPSLRSPYTAIIWEPTLALARASGVELVVRPVLPMVMRGVPATYAKGFYAWTDARREARRNGVDFGNFYDPVGNPIKRGYSLYIWARAQGRGHELLGAFLTAAFARGINTDSQTGLRKVVEMAGLNWAEARRHLQDDSWAAELEDNRSSLYAAGIWGVPSYRLLDRDGNAVLSVWGQDRLWLVSRKIAEHAR
jgi:2-hydroxychromene-2-carboxylate isomerase